MRKYRIIFLLLLAFPFAGNAQVVSTPYSGFGLGQRHYSQSVAQKAMGGIQTAYADQFYLNTGNPALLSKGNQTIIEAGALVELATTTQEENTPLKLTAGNLMAVNMSFALKPKRWSMSIGINPWSVVKATSLSAGKLDYLGEELEVEQFRVGSGGISEIHMAHGVELYKGFKIGAKVSYLFGSVDQSTTAIPNGDRAVEFDIQTIERLNLNSLRWLIGAHYEVDLNDYSLQAGVQYAATQKLGARLSRTANTRLGSLINSVAQSEISQDESIKVSMPDFLSTGVSIGKPLRWMVAVEYETESWSNFDDTRPTQNLVDASNIRVGGYFIPDYSSVNNYLKRIVYRGGFHSGKSRFTIDGKQLSDFGINFGVSLPLAGSGGYSSKASLLNLGFEYGTLGDGSNNSLKTQYFSLSIGATFNDIWSLKVKYD